MSAVLLFHAPVLFGRACWYLRDHGRHFFPTYRMVFAALREGRVPEWLDAAYGGIPLLADPSSAVLYPPSWLFAWLPWPHAYGWFIAVHHGLLVLSAYVLVRVLGAGVAGAAYGAVAYGFSGYVLSQLSFHFFLYSGVYVPAGLACFVLALNGRRLAWLACAACMALGVAFGEVQYVYDTGVLMLVWALVLPLGVRGGPWRARARALGVLAGTGAFSAALAAAQLLPAFAFLRGSSRVAEPSLARMEFSLHPARLLELLLPRFQGSLEDPETYLGPLFHPELPSEPTWTLSLYLGIAALPLAWVAVRRGAALERFLAVVALAALALAIGEHGLAYPLADALSPMPFRYPEKLALYLTLALALLAARGFELAAGEGRAGAARAALAVAGAGLAVAVTAALADVLPPDFAAARGHLVTQGLLAAALAAAAAATLRFVARPALLALLLAADVLAAGAGLAYVTPIEHLEAEPLVAAAVARHGGGHGERVWISRETGEPGIDAAYPQLPPTVRFYLWEHHLAHPNHGLGHGLAYVRGYSALAPAERLRAQRELLEGRGWRGLADAYGARFWVLPAGTAGLPGARELEPLPLLGAALWRSDTALPPAFVWTDPVPAQPPRTVTPHGEVELERPSPERVLARVHADAPGWLVLLDGFADGWTVQVDAAPAEPVRFAEVFRAVAVPAGSSRVEWTYRTPGLRAGAVVSGLALLAALAWVLAWTRRHAP